MNELSQRDPFRVQRLVGGVAAIGLHVLVAIVLIFLARPQQPGTTTAASQPFELVAVNIGAPADAPAEMDEPQKPLEAVPEPSPEPVRVAQVAESRPPEPKTVSEPKPEPTPTPASAVNPVPAPDPKPTPPKPEPKPQPKPEPKPKPVAYSDFVKQGGVSPSPTPSRPAPSRPQVDLSSIRKRLASIETRYSSASAGQATPGSQAALESYIASLRARVEAAWSQPPGGSGDWARVEIVIASTGAVEQVRIAGHSGSDSLAQSVLAAARAAGAGGHPPGGQPLTVSFRFELR